MHFYINASTVTSLKTLLVRSTCLSKNSQPDGESEDEPGKQENDGSQSQGINIILHLWVDLFILYVFPLVSI